MTREALFLRVAFPFVAVLLSSACGQAPVPDRPQRSVEDLISVIEASNPQSGGYSPGSEEFAGFGEAIQALLDMGPEGAAAAPHLAAALAFPRRDSYLAARPLVGLQSLAASALPILMENLNNEHEEVRRNSTYVLGTIGPPATCALEDVAALLWDPDPFVRTSAAAALENITGNDLVAYPYGLQADPASAGSVAADEPEGEITSLSREWWLTSGQYTHWSPGDDACSP